MLGVFVRPGRLEPILTQVCSLTSPFQIPLHELDPRNQAVGNSGEVPMLLEVGRDAPRGHFVGFFV